MKLYIFQIFDKVDWAWYSIQVLASSKKSAKKFVIDNEPNVNLDEINFDQAREIKIPGLIDRIKI